MGKSIADIMAAGSGLTDSWQLQDAKAKFSTLVQNAVQGRPQIISKHGKDVAILLNYLDVLDAINPPESMLDFFQRSPLAGIELDLERLEGPLREVEL